MFNLMDYVHDIQDLAVAQGIEAEEAVNAFIVNLAVMKPQYPVVKDLNFRQLGQQWNSLMSNERIKQKTEVLKAMRTTKGDYKL